MIPIDTQVRVKGQAYPSMLGKGALVFYKHLYFMKMFIFLFSECTLLLDYPVVCENFSRIAVQISFLWCLKHGVYAAASFSAKVTSWCSHNDTQLVLLFCRRTSYLSHIDCFVVILKFYTVQVFLHAVRNFVNQKHFQANMCQLFFIVKIWRHFSITSQLR